MGTNKDYQRRRQLADLTFPCRLTFDAPIIAVAQMAEEADASFGFTHVLEQRISFYFASPERMMRFVEKFSPDRVPTNSEMIAAGRGREAKSHWVSIKIPN
ncbi:hypothetical protein [Pyruvatibacter sp.]|uniref:hypothetical protein n=1 Tax=Pyruvatibacter sp. TaxID=1981328 RepID=UPI0032EEEC6E